MHEPPAKRSKTWLSNDKADGSQHRVHASQSDEQAYEDYERHLGHEDFCLRPWMSVKVGIDLGQAWAEELHYQNVDDAAQKTLFALAQSSHEGYKSACGLIAKIYKKEANGQEIKSPSAFIHRSCMKTWDLLAWGHE